MVKKQYNTSEVHDHNILIDTREIFLGSHISSDENDPGIDYRSAVNFIKNLRILESINNKPIIIHQYNIGGDVNAGFAIYDAIKSSTCQFVFICYGTASSMGSIIPQAVLGKGLRVTTENCEWLLHYGSVDINGTHNRVMSTLQYYDRYKQKFLDIYAEAANNGAFFINYKKANVFNFIKSQLTEKEDWIFSGTEAVSYGFADGILGDEGYTDVLRIL